MQTSTAVSAASFVSTSSEQLVTVLLDRETYGFPIEMVESVVRWEPLTRLPRLPRFLAGLLNLRGKIVPVIDMRRRLDLPAEACGPNQRIVIAQVNGCVVGLIVDAVLEVIRVEAEQIETHVPLISTESGAGLESAALRGVANLPQGFVILPDLERLLSTGEQNQLARLDAKHNIAPIP